MHIALSQDSTKNPFRVKPHDGTKNAFVLNVGYPAKVGFYYPPPIYNRKNLLFLGVGIERQLPNNIFYSIGVASYNISYKTCTSCLCYDDDDYSDQCVMSRIEPKITIWKEFLLNKRNVLDIGLGVIGHYELEIQFDEKECGEKNIFIIGSDIGIQSSMKYYYILSKIRNQLGLLIECNWFGNANQLDLGVGITYRFNF